MSSIFVVFVVFIPRADRGVVYMRVLEKFGGFGGFVATDSEVSNMCGRGKFDGCEGRIRPNLMTP